MSSTIVQHGNNSVTFKVDAVPSEYSPSGYSYGYLTKADWATIPNSRIKDVLNRNYGPVGTPEELEASSTAFAEAIFAVGLTLFGLERADRPAMGLHGDVQWADLDTSEGNEGYPAVGFTGAFFKSSALPSYIRISLAYSASE